MAAMPASCVDLVVTDPPFAIRFKAGRSNYNRKAGNVLPGYMEVEREDCGVQPGLDRRGAPRPQGLWLDVRVFGVDPPQGRARRPRRGRLRDGQPHRVEVPVRRGHREKVRHLPLPLHVRLQGRLQAQVLRRLAVRPRPGEVRGHGGCMGDQARVLEGGEKDPDETALRAGAQDTPVREPARRL